MATRIQIRRDTSTNWEANNPVLAIGEPGLETDTFIIKYGDGSSAWNDLPYANIDSLADFTTTDLREGTNLYFTNARVYANTLSAGFVSNTYATNAQLALYATNAQVGSFVTNDQLTVYATNVDLTSKVSLSALNTLSFATNAQLNAITTTAITEGSNLFFTSERVYANLLNLGYSTNAQLSNYATNAQVGSYATNAQLATYATNSQLGSYATNAQLSNYVTTGALLTTTTAGIAESGNLYFTNVRVTSALTSPTANITLGNVMRLVNYTYDEMIALTGAERGWIIFETSNNIFRGYNGTAWSNLG